jgi:hypothetical protein
MPKRDFIHPFQLPELERVKNYQENKTTLIFQAKMLSDLKSAQNAPPLQNDQ